MKVRETLIPSVALDFIKAYECVASHPPHLARLEEDEIEWEEIVELSLNVVLRKPLRTPLAKDIPSQDPPSPSHTDNSEMFVEDSLAYNEDEDMDALPGSKRRRGASQPGPAASKHPRFTTSKPVSAEQVACMSLLSVLFKSSSAPLLKSSIVRPVLRSLEGFFEIYSSETSLHHDFLAATLSTLKHVSLNHKDDVVRFAANSWDRLLDLWGTKNKALKEGLVSILRMLFPFLTADPNIGESPTKPWIENLTKLWYLMCGQGDKRWNLDPLSLCAVRLEVSTQDDYQKAFRAKTFRASAQLDPFQALTWAMLELQADCLAKLYQHFESNPVSSTQPQSTQSSKRPRLLENPVTSLLKSVQQPPMRIYNLQILLFFIDRHWNTPHESMQSDIIRTLLDHVTNDDGTVQSWAFVCLAALASADCDNAASLLSSQTLSASAVPPTTIQTRYMTSVSTRGASTWDSVWTHAIRRTNSPQVCRAACHTASILLVYANTGSARQSLVRSSLTSHRVLSEIETLAKDLDVQGPVAPFDSVCTFLSLCLKVANQDVRLYRMQLEEKVLTWLIDSWRPAHMEDPEAPLYLVSDVLTLLEAICSSSQRSSLVCRVNLPQCLIVETLIAEEQTRVIRDYLLDAKLPSVKFDGSRPESSASPNESSDLGNATFMAPIPAETDLVQPRSRERKISVFFLKCLESALSPWQEGSDNTIVLRAPAAKRALDIAVVQATFSGISEVFKDILRVVMGQPSKLPADAMVVDDSFSTAGRSPSQSLGATLGTAAQISATRQVAGISILFLSVGPLLQQSAGEPTRDKELTELMLEGAELDLDRFLLACPVYFNCIRNQTLNLSLNHLAQFITVLADHLVRYPNVKSEEFNLQMISFLDATLSLWISLANVNQNAADNFRELFDHYSKHLLRGRLKHWKIRDSVARLYNRYLTLDPSQNAWMDQDEQTTSPMYILPMLIEDIDIRVRFRVVVINARLFEISKNPMALYDTIRQKYTTELEHFELMLTRILSLGNIMVVSSAVRRGPYWHLLETCFFSTKYNRHIETLLTGVSQRMGLNKLSDLFEAYAYQLAFSILQGEHNVLQLPVNLLGYRDLKERANETIRAFTPANLVVVGNPTIKEAGRSLFVGHCQATQRQPEEVIPGLQNK
ncbi:ataxia telangiectasia mutated [Lentinula edodes]|uniref:Ataxia telangiectasia mutated n=1 Tax=Lentinula edodes TaxID=5353 RepID=A0A1Q3E2H7_LENED|nr:ataxia telangiectasia mutated [Lentinula edodes]